MNGARGGEKGDDVIERGPSDLREIDGGDLIEGRDGGGSCDG